MFPSRGASLSPASQATVATSAVAILTVNAGPPRFSTHRTPWSVGVDAAGRVAAVGWTMGVGEGATEEQATATKVRAATKTRRVIVPSPLLEAANKT